MHWGVLAVASWSTAQPTAALAALACAAFAIPGGYIAFFHSAKLLVFDFAIATATATAAAWRLAGEMNRATAGATLWLLLLTDRRAALPRLGGQRSGHRLHAR
jgi:hypothetical protein